MTQNRHTPESNGISEAFALALLAESSVIIATIPHDGQNELKIMTAFNGGNARKYKALLADSGIEDIADAER